MSKDKKSGLFGEPIISTSDNLDEGYDLDDNGVDVDLDNYSFKDKSTGSSNTKKIHEESLDETLEPSEPIEYQDEDDIFSDEPESQNLPDVRSSNTSVEPAYEDEPKKSFRNFFILALMAAVIIACCVWFGFNKYFENRANEQAEQLAEQQRIEQQEKEKAEQEKKQKELEEQKKAQEQQNNESNNSDSYDDTNNYYNYNDSSPSNSDENYTAPTPGSGQPNYAIDEPENENDLKDYGEADYQNRVPQESTAPDPLPQTTEESTTTEEYTENSVESNSETAQEQSETVEQEPSDTQ